jgi:conjugative relaxase-like TrwC/TraI family protein
VGFDATLTTEKSLGVLALLSDDTTRRTVLDTIQAANDWALRWLEANHAVARERGEVVGVKGWAVASFRHYTSRALDPFPHLHNVVLNTVEDHKGVRRALDARSLYVGAHAASALATAEMRYRLTCLLGVRWRQSRHGGWEIASIPEAVLREFSQRRTEIEDALRELEEAIGRGTTLDEVDQIAKTTRPPKAQASVDDLQASWWQRAGALGFGPHELAGCVGEPVEPPEPDLDMVFAQLGGPDGICQNISVFNRGDLLNALVDLPINTDGRGEAQPMRVPAARLEEIADQFLASRWVEQISDATDSRPARYSTAEMLALQGRIVARHASGLRRGAALVPAHLLREALAGHPQLTDEQVKLVTAFCSSGYRIACAIGHPGAGKTTAMRAARQAWEAAGLRVIGAAVKGEAARTLAAATGIATETLAWHLAHDDPHTSTLDARTVIVVDEASTVSDRDLDRLGWLADQTGATIRLIGDPAQHSAVAAGGMFRVLCELHPKHTAQLTQTHRLRDSHDRAAADALREGDVVEALSQVSSYVQVLTNWWHAHLAGNDHPMVDRTNTVRHALNRLAHTLRVAHGELGDDHIVSQDRHFALGDHVIARTPNRHLHPKGQRANYVRNGARGTVSAIRHGQAPEDDVVTVTFGDIGTIDLPRSFVDEHEIGPGQSGVGLDYAYAVTSYAVTGSTQPISTSRINETSTRAETYVDITRGQIANHLYLTRATDPLDGEHLPRVPPEPLAQDIADQLHNSQGERTAWEIRQETFQKSVGEAALGM